jgi:hypothetical protein
VIGNVVTNFFYSIRYSFDKVHAGIAACFGDLQNEGKRERLNLVLDRLMSASLTEHNALRAAWECKRMDLRTI